jgi:hypothetical protein
MRLVDDHWCRAACIRCWAGHGDVVFGHNPSIAVSSQLGLFRLSPFPVPVAEGKWRRSVALTAAPIDNFSGDEMT